MDGSAWDPHKPDVDWGYVSEPWSEDWAPDPFQDVVLRALARERAGAYSAPLPPPNERRRIRTAAGFTLDVLAGEVEDEYERLTGAPPARVLSAGAVGRWERPAGYRGRTKLPGGREPSGDLRRAYSGVLLRLLGEARDDAERRGAR